MRGRDEQRRNGLRDYVAADRARLDGDEHIAILQRQAATHPSIESSVGILMYMPEARVHPDEVSAMLRAELHDVGYVLGASRSHARRKSAGAEPVFRHIEGNRLVAMTLIDRAQRSGCRAGRHEKRRPCRCQCGLGRHEQRLGRAWWGVGGYETVVEEK